MHERVYLRGRIWWGWYYDQQGNPQYSSTRCRDKPSAEAVVREWERRAADPHYAPTDETTVEVAIRWMMADRRLRGRAKGTLEMYEQKAGHIVRLWGADRLLSTVDAPLVDRFAETRLDEGAERSTVHKELTTVRVALKVAKRRGHFRADIGEVMPNGFSIDYTPKDTFLTGHELELLLTELFGYQGARVAWLVATGARWGESDRARKGDIRRDQGLVYIRGSKTDLSAAPVPIVGAAWDLLAFTEAHASGPAELLFEPWGNVRRDLHLAAERIERARIVAALKARGHTVPGTRLTVRRIADGLATLAPAAREAIERRAAFPRISPNDLRRTTGTWLRLKQVEPHFIAGMLRHADSRMVERVYGKLPVEALGMALRERLGDVKQCETNCSAVVVNASQNPPSAASLADAVPSNLPGNLVPRDRIELSTRGFSVRCSTN
jgi:integrase